MSIKLLPCIFSMLLINGLCLAEDVSIDGTIEINLPVTRAQRLVTPHAKLAPRIALLKLDLTADAQNAISNRIQKTQHGLKSNDLSTIYPRKVQLGMNGVPVLNQGSHGTCVTFADTAAVDAILGKGDYISQLCQLELGTYLEKNSYTSSGWNGSWGRIILSQMDVFGLVSKDYQKSNGCAGLIEYPMTGDAPSEELSVTDYHQISEVMRQDSIAWSSLLEAYQVSSDQVDGNKVLMDIKKSLNAGDRLTFGVLLLDFNQGISGAVGTYHQKFDTWVLTPEIAKDINDQTEFAGHEMIITGYDDDAIAIDHKGRSYRGLLTLRNSWGSNIGDNGDFYMSYDYFKSLMIEAQRIRHLV